MVPKGQRFAIERPRSLVQTCASVHKFHVLPGVWFLCSPSLFFFLLLVGLCTRVVGDHVCAHHPLTDLRVSAEHNPALHPFSTI